jgi:hypothetical protein
MRRDTADLSAKIPVLSEIEEARALQYQCECIETACLEQGKASIHPTVPGAAIGLVLDFDRRVVRV